VLVKLDCLIKDLITVDQVGEPAARVRI